MKKKIAAVFKYLIFLGIGIFLIWWQSSKMTPVQRVQFRDSLQHANYILIIPIIIIAIFSHITRALRWKIMLEHMGYHPATSNTFYATMCGYFANTFIPRAGEILKCTLLARYEKIPVNKLIGTILVERFFDLFCYFLIIVFTICIQLNTVSDFIKKKVLLISNKHEMFDSWIILLVLLLVGFFIIIFAKWVLKKYPEHRHIIKLKGFHIGLKEGFISILRLKKRKLFLLYTLFIWTFYLLQIYIGFFALSATTGLGLKAALSVLTLVTLSMIVAPGGIGAFPVAIQQVLLIYSIDNISFGWLMWSVSTIIIIVAGLISFGLLIYNNRKSDEAKQ
ncbi:MAG: lysylphosphatidylglycerol synthase transmembrane domain-containing protein [Ginsengibacter sp.]